MCTGLLAPYIANNCKMMGKWQTQYALTMQMMKCTWHSYEIERYDSIIC